MAAVSSAALPKGRRAQKPGPSPAPRRARMSYGGPMLCGVGPPAEIPKIDGQPKIPQAAFDQLPPPLVAAKTQPQQPKNRVSKDRLQRDEDFDRVVFEEHGGPQVDCLVSLAKTAKPAHAWKMFKNNGHNLPSRTKVAEWLTVQFERQGLKDEWLIAALCLFDRLAMACTSGSSMWNKGPRAPALAVALTAMKLGGAETELEKGMQDVLHDIASRFWDKKLWNDVISAEMRSLRILEYCVNTPSPLDLCIRLTVDVVIEGERHALDDWDGMKKVVPSQGQQFPMIIAVKFGYFAAFLLELGYTHIPEEAYRVNPMPLGLSLAALKISLKAYGAPSYFTEPSSSLGKAEGLLDKIQAYRLQRLTQSLEKTWSNAQKGPLLGSAVVRKWKSRGLRLGCSPWPAGYADNGTAAVPIVLKEKVGSEAPSPVTPAVDASAFKFGELSLVSPAASPAATPVAAMAAASPTFGNIMDASPAASIETTKEASETQTSQAARPLIEQATEIPESAVPDVEAAKRQINCAVKGDPSVSSQSTNALDEPSAASQTATTEGQEDITPSQNSVVSDQTFTSPESFPTPSETIDYSQDAPTTTPLPSNCVSEAAASSVHAAALLEFDCITAKGKGHSDEDAPSAVSTRASTTCLGTLSGFGSNASSGWLSVDQTSSRGSEKQAEIDGMVADESSCSGGALPGKGKLDPKRRLDFGTIFEEEEIQTTQNSDIDPQVAASAPMEPLVQEFSIREDAAAISSPVEPRDQESCPTGDAAAASAPEDSNDQDARVKEDSASISANVESGEQESLINGDAAATSTAFGSGDQKPCSVEKASSARVPQADAEMECVGCEPPAEIAIAVAEIQSATCESSAPQVTPVEASSARVPQADAEMECAGCESSAEVASAVAEVQSAACDSSAPQDTPVEARSVRVPQADAEMECVGCCESSAEVGSAVAEVQSAACESSASQVPPVEESTAALSAEPPVRRRRLRILCRSISCESASTANSKNEAPIIENQAPAADPSPAESIPQEVLGFEPNAIYGCSRCRMQAKGCTSCSPVAALRYRSSKGKSPTTTFRFGRPPTKDLDAALASIRLKDDWKEFAISCSPYTSPECNAAPSAKKKADRKASTATVGKGRKAPQKARTDQPLVQSTARVPPAAKVASAQPSVATLLASAATRRQVPEAEILPAQVPAVPRTETAVRKGRRSSAPAAPAAPTAGKGAKRSASSGRTAAGPSKKKSRTDIDSEETEYVPKAGKAGKAMTAFRSSKSQSNAGEVRPLTRSASRALAAKTSSEEDLDKLIDSPVNGPPGPVADTGSGSVSSRPPRSQQPKTHLSSDILKRHRPSTGGGSMSVVDSATSVSTPAQTQSSSLASQPPSSIKRARISELDVSAQLSKAFRPSTAFRAIQAVTSVAAAETVTTPAAPARQESPWMSTPIIVVDEEAPRAATKTRSLRQRKPMWG